MMTGVTTLVGAAVAAVTLGWSACANCAAVAKRSAGTAASAR
jgi:hypothetical protein